MASVPAAPDESELSSGWDSEPHPWRRYGARAIDNFVFGGIFSFLVMFGAGVVLAVATDEMPAWLIQPPLWVDVLIYMPMGIAGACLGNALCYPWWGATPGKWIFRLKVRAEDGDLLGWRQAFVREVGMFWWGFGCGIPFVSLFMLARSYSELENDGETCWDGAACAQSRARSIEGVGYFWIALGVVIVIASKSAGMFAMMSDAAPVK
jgi:uncharacterized RDD family membrane protein YckC